MSLETAHKILIGAAVAFFLFYALFEGLRWQAGSGTGALARGAGGLGAAGVFALYLVSFFRNARPR